MPPSYALTFSVIEIFWNTKVFSNEIFCYSGTKTFRRKIVIPLPNSYPKKTFSLPENFWNTEWFPGESFSVLWDKKNRQNREASPSFAWKFSIPEFFRNTEGFSYELYRHCETKFFQRTLWYPLPMHETLRFTIFLQHQTAPQRNILVLCDKSFPRRNMITSPYPNFLDTRNYWNSKGFSYGNFRHCETKNFRRKILILPPSYP